LAGRFDLAFVLVFLLPLLILVLSYNVLSQEKERGTLQITLAQSPLSIGKLVFGKIVARLTLVLALTIGLSIPGLFVSGATLNSHTLPRLLLWILATMLYTFFWFALAIAVNAFGRSSATNAVILGACGWY